MTLSIRTDRRLIHTTAPNTRYLLVGFTAPESRDRTNRLPVNVAFVLDRSGSMRSAQKFGLAREAVERALRMLHPDDRFSLIVYDDRVDVLMESTRATPEATREAISVLRHVYTRDATDLCAGWMRGCEQIATHLNDESVSRALLLTDGLANRGTIDPARLTQHATELRPRGIATSTFGVGADFDERLLRDIAHEGGGNFYYIETPAQIVDLMTSELGEALEVVGRDVAVNIAIPRGATAEPLSRFRFRFDRAASNLRIDLGDIVSGQDVRAVVELRLPNGAVGDHLYADVSLTGQGIDSARETIHWTFASDADNDSQPRDVEVDREVGVLYAARARAEATEANRYGELTQAHRVLESAYARIHRMAAGDQEMTLLAADLLRDAPRYARAQMNPSALKRAFADAQAIIAHRTPDGKAQRGEEAKP